MRRNGSSKEGTVTAKEGGRKVRGGEQVEFRLGSAAEKEWTTPVNLNN